MYLKLSRFFFQTSPLPQHLLKFLPSGAWGPGETKMVAYDGALQMKARILPERSLVFQFSDFLLSGSFKCDKKKVLNLEQEGLSP